MGLLPKSAAATSSHVVNMLIPTATMYHTNVCRECTPVTIYSPTRGIEAAGSSIASSSSLQSRLFSCAVESLGMSGEIIVHSDDIIKEGWLVKQSMHLKDWRRRWCILTPQYLCTFKQQGQYRNPTEAIRLRECSTAKSGDDDTGKENSFRVDTPTRVFHLIADTATGKEAWIGTIGRQMVRPTVMTEDFE